MNNDFKCFIHVSIVLKQGVEGSFPFSHINNIYCQYLAFTDKKIVLELCEKKDYLDVKTALNIHSIKKYQTDSKNLPKSIFNLKSKIFSF